MLRPLAVVLLLFTASGCDSGQSEEQRLFNDQAFFAAPSGITRVSASGEIATEDADDWRVGPGFATAVVEVYPATPNPMLATGETTVTLNLLRGLPGRATLYVVDARGDLLPVVPLNPPDVSGAGFPAFTVSAAELSPLGQPGLVRVVLLDDRLNVITYGDIEVAR